MKILKNKDYRIIAENFSYLSILKFFNIGFKFILIAYLVRVLGTGLNGVLTWADSIIQFFLMLINFGFNIYASKYIVDNRGKKENINEIVSSIYFIKFILFLTSFLILLLSSIFEPIAENLGLLSLMLIMGVGEVLFPIWFFQGMEKLVTATKIVFVSRLFIVVSTLLFVTSPDDMFLYVGLIVVSNVIMGVLGSYSLINKYDVHFYLVSFKTLSKYFKAASMFFLGRFLSLVFNFGTIFLVGIYASMDDVTGFDIATKAVMIAVIPFEMLQQAVFPTISRTKDRKLLIRLVLFSFITGLFLMFILNILASDILLLFGGEELLVYTDVLRFLSFMTPMICVTFILGSCGLVAFGFYKEYNLSLLVSSVLYILLILILKVIGEITFWNLIYLRVLSDFILVSIRGFYAIKRGVITFKWPLNKVNTF